MSTHHIDDFQVKVQNAKKKLKQTMFVADIFQHIIHRLTSLSGAYICTKSTLLIQWRNQNRKVGGAEQH